MIDYIECTIEAVRTADIYIFGSGQWGTKCANYIKKNGGDFCGFLDNDTQKWNQLHCGKMIFSPDTLLAKNARNIRVIVAVESYESIVAQLDNLNVEKIYLYFPDKIYEKRVVSILGTADDKELKKRICNRNVYIYGKGKYLEDFLYIFDELEICGIETEISLHFHEENDLMIICDFETEVAQKKLEQNGFVKNESYIIGEDLFCLLNSQMLAGGRIPSVWMRKTLYAPMLNQKKCLQPFTHIQIGARFTAHSCCPDWGEQLGNLKYNSLEEIWNSINLKIFRLSMINRTYSFCNAQNCVHLKDNVEITTERISEGEIPRVGDCPSYFEIGIDKTCNLFCESCRREVLVESESRREQINVVKAKIINSGWLEKVDKLLLGGDGEVFFSPVYKDIMFQNAASRKSLDLRTNGTIIEESFLEKLQTIYQDLSIIVSIDAATKETYNTLRRSKNSNTWDHLLENLELLAKQRYQNKINFFQINMCVQMKNYREIPDFVRMGVKLGVDRVYLTPIRNWGTYSKECFEVVGIYDNKKQLKKEVVEVLQDPILKTKKLVVAL